MVNHLSKLLVWLNGWVFGYKLSGFRFESRCNLKPFPEFHPYFFLFLWKFTPNKAIQPVLSMELHEKEKAVRLGNLIAEVQV